MFENTGLEQGAANLSYHSMTQGTFEHILPTEIDASATAKMPPHHRYRNHKQHTQHGSRVLTSRVWKMLSLIIDSGEAGTPASNTCGTEETKAWVFDTFGTRD